MPAPSKAHMYKLVIKKLFTGDFRLALIIAICWQLMMTLTGSVIDATTDNLIREGTQSGSFSFLDHMSRWDAGWYREILANGYSLEGNPAAPAFYPLFPLLVSVLSILTFGQVDVLFLVLFLNTVCLWFALAALIKITRVLLGDKHTYLVVALFITSPAAIFMHMFYTEALFTAIGLWAYLFALRKQWAYMGVTLAVLTATRIPSLLFVGLCGLEFLRSYQWNVKKALFNKELFWFLLAPIGFLAYGTFLYFRQGDFLAMFHAYDKTTDWVYQTTNINIFATLWDALGLVVDAAQNKIPFDEPWLVNVALPLIGLAILLTASLVSIFVIRKKFIPLGLFGIASLIMFTLNSNTLSVHRYLLPIITIYLAVAWCVKTWPKTLPVALMGMYTGVILQAVLVTLFINNYFAG